MAPSIDANAEYALLLVSASAVGSERVGQQHRVSGFWFLKLLVDQATTQSLEAGQCLGSFC